MSQGDDSGDEEKRGLVCKVYCALKKPLGG